MSPWQFSSCSPCTPSVVLEFSPFATPLDVVQHQLTRTLQIRGVSTSSNIRVKSGNMRFFQNGSRCRLWHCKRSQGPPWGRNWMGRGNKSEVDLNLPAFVYLSSASMSAGGPGAVGYTNQVGTNKIQSMYL